jgi:hypothetical protein
VAPSPVDFRMENPVEITLGVVPPEGRNVLLPVSDARAAAGHPRLGDSMDWIFEYVAPDQAADIMAAAGAARGHLRHRPHQGRIAPDPITPRRDSGPFRITSWAEEPTRRMIAGG